MPTIESVYTGELRTEAKHSASGKIIITDAPIDNLGRGEAFSPSDLLAASLGSCMLTLMGISAKGREINIDGTKISITKIMAANPRRVAEIVIVFDMPDQTYSPEQKSILEYAALNCPVAKSIHPDIIQNITFNYKD
ncbi:MAG: OsmC family protein [Bacteroidia bacterium]